MNTDPLEIALLEGLARNDRQSIEALYTRHFSMIQSLIINNSGTYDDAKDIFQEAMIVLYERVKSGTFELNCQLKTYLYSVCRRLWLKRLHVQQRYIPELNGIEETVGVEEELNAQEQRNQEFVMMEKALMRLGEPCKSLIESFYLQRKNMSEIAAEFGYTNADNAKNQKYKCLLRLKKLFFSEYKYTNA